MRIAIVGGTGTLGRHVTAELAQRGHEVRVLSRSSADYPVDLATGSGLGRALDGCAAVVDASNAASAKRAAQVLVHGSQLLLAAEQTAGVDHHVCVSIVGCELLPMGYYQVKTDQERAVREGPVPWTIVKATQFHELAATVLTTASRFRVLPVPRLQLQTVAAAEVAQAVAEIAEGVPRQGAVQVAGPQIVSARQLAQTWRSVTGRYALLLPVPLPGKLGRMLRAGGLTAQRPDILGTTSFADWLTAQHTDGS